MPVEEFLVLLGDVVVDRFVRDSVRITDQDRAQLGAVVHRRRVAQRIARPDRVRMTGNQAQVVIDL